MSCALAEGVPDAFPLIGTTRARGSNVHTAQTAINAAQLAVGLCEPDNVTLLAVLASVPGEHVEELDEPTFTPEEQARESEAEMAAVNRELARVSP